MSVDICARILFLLIIFALLNVNSVYCHNNNNNNNNNDCIIPLRGIMALCSRLMDIADHMAHWPSIFSYVLPSIGVD